MMTTSDDDTPGFGPGSEDSVDLYEAPALERGLRMLCEFNLQNRSLTVPELARRFRLSRATVSRLLASLETLGFVERAEDSRRYRLGVAVLRLGFEYLATLPINEAGLPLLERLSKRSQYPCNLVVRDGRHIVYVAKVTPQLPFSSSVRVGTRLPAHATVLGRILLANLTLPELRKLYPEERLESFSIHTPRTVVDLFNLVQGDRQRGYVLAEGFFEAGISTIAAPVRDRSGSVVATLGMTVTAAHIDLPRAQDLVREVCAAADELSTLLDYVPAGSGANVVPLHAPGRTY